MSPTTPRAVADHPVWLIDGDDPTLVAGAVRGLVDELLGDQDRSLVVEDHQGDDVDLASVADACRTPPFLAGRRIVVVRDIGVWDTAGVAPLVEYLADPLDTTTLVLVAGGGTPAPKLVAAVRSTGHVTSTRVKGREAQAWVQERIRATPIRLDRDAEHLIEAHLGEDVSRLPALLEVLVAALGSAPGRLGPADIEPYLGEAGTVAPWDLTDAIDAGRTEVALTVLHRLLGAGDRHPLVVLSILARWVANALRVDGPSIRTEAQAAAAMGIIGGRSTFPARKALATARSFGSDGLAEAVCRVADAEVALKGGLDWSGPLVLEVLVARLCRLAKVGRSGRGRPAGAPRPPVSLTVLDQLAAGGAAMVAGVINAAAGGGTLISFPALVALGLPTLSANVTNTVALCPGYLSGTWTQRDDLRPQLPKARRLAPFAAAGSLVGSLLLEVTPNSAFRAAVPWLVLLACALLLAQDRVRAWVVSRGGGEAPGDRPSLLLSVTIFAIAVYGGFFGAGLGILLLAVLGLFGESVLARTNALKQALSLAVQVMSAVVFSLTGHVRWTIVPVMAVGALLGGTIGARVAQRVPATPLRRAVVVYGVAVAISFWVT